MPLPVLSIAQTRKWEEATWASGTTPQQVIARVGLKLAEWLLRLSAPGQSVLVVAGKGNNGADARAAVAHLHERRVSLVEIHNPESELDPLATALACQPDLILDGLFGIGLDRPLSPAWWSFHSGGL